MSLPPRILPPLDVEPPTWSRRGALAASHLVAHDAVARSPRERAQMLRRIGITRLVWDWRDEHVDQLDAELDALRSEGVELAGMWTPLPMPALEEPDYSSRFGIVPQRLRTMMGQAARRGLAPDLWTQIAFGSPGAPRELAPQAHRHEVLRAADHLTGLVRVARGHGMCVVLTNHGGWAGEPQTMTDVVGELAARGFTNVGIGLRLQHAHHLVADLDTHLDTMREHLVAVMLSGVDAQAELSGRVILPFGAGSRDRWVTHALLESGWQGQLLIHAVGRDDSEARLLDSIEGWEWALDRWLRRPRQRPVPRILRPTWPPGPDWVGRPSALSPAAPAVTPTAPPAPHLLRPDAAAAFFGSIDRSAASQRELPAVAAEAQLITAQIEAQMASPLSMHTTLGAEPAVVPDAAQALAQAPGPQAFPSPAYPWARPPAAHVASAVSRRERRMLEERRAAEARRAERERQLLESVGTPRIGHGDVKIVAPDPYSGAIHALLLHLEDEGFEGAPRSFGWDANGHHLLEFVDGMRADHPRAPEDALDPARLGAFLREMHDALARFEPPADAQWFDGVPAPGAELIVHHDIAPSNIVVRANGSLVAIDWDAAGPGTRLWDLAYAAHSFAPLYRVGGDALASSVRLRRMVDAYGLSDAQRDELVPLLAARSLRMYDYLDRMRITGASPWVELWERGVGAVWHADAEWIDQNAHVWREALLA